MNKVHVNWWVFVVVVVFVLSTAAESKVGLHFYKPRDKAIILAI